MQLSFPFGESVRLAMMRKRLLSTQGAVRDLQRHEPEPQLVKAIISSRTLDKVSGPVFRELRRRFQPLDFIATAEPEDILGVIGPVTYADRKAEQLIRSVQMVVASQGRFSLAFLADWSVEDSLRWVQRLPGAGPKVAAATLNFSTLRKRALAVDTHVLRLSKKLGLVPAKADFKKAFRLLTRLIPDEWDSDDLYELHWLMKRHGQEICRAERVRNAATACSGSCAPIRASDKQKVNRFTKT
jgi:endonuclease III